MKRGCGLGIDISVSSRINVLISAIYVSVQDCPIGIFDPMLEVKIIKLITIK